MTFSRKNVVVAITAGILAFPALLPALTPGDFSKRLDITFGGYTRGTSLTNFPTLVVLSSGIDQFDYGDFTSPTGGDLRFTDAGGAIELPYEIDVWDTSGSSYVWVRAPLLSGTNTMIRAYWGAADTTPPAYTTNGAVWAENYANVLHFQDANVAGPYLDSSPATNHAAVTGDLNHRAGQIGPAKFMIDGEYVQTVRDAPVTGAVPRTLSMWINPPHSTGQICSLGSNDGALGAFGMAARSRYLHIWAGGSDGVASTHRLRRNGWNHIAATYDGTRYALYADGAEVLSGAVALDTQPYGAIVGSPAWQTYQNGYNFIADEFRCSTVARHPDWIWASWFSQSSNDQFADYGSVENAVETVPNIANNAARNITATSATFAGTLTSTGAAPTTVSLFWGTSDAGTQVSGWDATNGFGEVIGTPPVALGTNITGLATETTYYYRFYATNAHGEAWGTPARSFTTLSLAPDVVNLPATNVGMTTATLQGGLTYTGGAPVAVTAFWGPYDAGTFAAAWAHTNHLGTNTSPAPVLLSSDVTGLEPERRYYYRFYVTNAYGEAWGTPTVSFTALRARPAIDNLPPANVTTDAAALRGSLTYTGGAPAEVTVYWGGEDGGTAPAAWANTNYLGTNAQPVPATLSAAVGDLLPKRNYYYRFHAGNSFGEAWASSSASFVTSDEFPVELIPAGSVWRYLDDGSDQGTNWAQIGFDESTWTNGPAQLGYGDGDEATEISYGGNQQSKHITYYFRNTFVLTRGQALALRGTELRVLRDDGAIVYLNGTEIFRSNMPTGSVDYLTRAGYQTGGENVYHPTNVPPHLFREGTNVVAAEVHQNSPTSSDLSFDLEMTGAIFYPAVGFFPVPSVTNFVLEASFRNLVTPTANDYSGCALSERRRQVLSPNRDFTLGGTATIQVFGMDGVHDRQILMPGWSDLEGLRVMDDASDLFAVLEEGTGDITLVTIGPETTLINKPADGYWATGVDGSGNKGLEGVAYDAKRDCFYVVKEKYPLSVFRVSGTPTNTVVTPLFDGASVFAGRATDLSDVCFDPQLDRLLILSDEAATVFECKLDGTITASLPVEGSQPEGVALSADGTELHVTSEPARYYRYRRGGLGGRSLEGTNVAITVALTTPWTNDVSVAYAINNGSAVFGNDMTNGGGMARGTVVIAAGATQGVIHVGIVEDGIPEEDELFTVSLDMATNAVLGDARSYIHTIEPVRKRLAVASTHGTPEPAVGDHDLPEGTIVTCRLPDALLTTAATQYVCIGWAGAGSVPASGATTTTGPRTLTNDSSISWLWSTNHWLGAAVEGHGDILNGNRWYGRGTNVTVTAVAGPYCSFMHWTGDVEAGETNSPTANLLMDAGKQVTAHFDVELATNRTPKWWLAEHYGSTHDFDALALSDSDGDGQAAWEEYWGGSIPTNALDAFRVAAIAPLPPGTARLRWTALTDRLYTLYMATNVVSPQWTNVLAVPGNGADLFYTPPSGPGGPRYYRLGVQLRE